MCAGRLFFRAACLATAREAASSVSEDALPSFPPDLNMLVNPTKLIAEALFQRKDLLPKAKAKLLQKSSFSESCWTFITMLELASFILLVAEVDSNTESHSNLFMYFKPLQYALQLNSFLCLKMLLGNFCRNSVTCITSNVS